MTLTADTAAQGLGLVPVPGEGLVLAPVLAEVFTGGHQLTDMLLERYTTTLSIVTFNMGNPSHNRYAHY